MKRKIQHDAVNNQEDEDSCTFPISLLTDDKKEGKSIENNITHSFSDPSSNKDESTGNRRYP